MTRFVVSGVARLGIGLIALLVTMVGAQLVSGWLLAMFGATIVYATAFFGIAPVLQDLAEQNRARILVGRGPFAPNAFRALAFIALYALLPVVLVGATSTGAREWFAERGGPSAVYLTISLAIVAILGASTALRLVAAPVALATPAVRRIATDSRLERIWDSGEATLALSVPLLCAFSIAIGSVGAGGVITHYDDTGHPVKPQPSAAFDQATDTELLRGLAPIVTLADKDDWYPQRADAYFRESEVYDTRTGRRVLEPDLDKPAPCPGPKPCLVMRNPKCPDSPACAIWALPDGRDPIEDDRFVAYGHVARRDTSTSVRWDASPFGDKLIGVAQWWVFAPYDEWSARIGVTGVRVVQSHAADWEAITIGYSATGPLFVGLTAHCGGTWRLFRDTDLPNVQTPKWEVLGRFLHTDAAYAVGSHAFYFEPESGRAPNSVECGLKRGKSIAAAATYAANHRDRTGSFRSVFLTPIVGRESERVLTYPAYWAVTEGIRVRNPVNDFGGPTGNIRSPRGPDSPGSKSLYRDPVGTIFCSDRWHYEGPSRDLEKARC